MNNRNKADRVGNERFLTLILHLQPISYANVFEQQDRSFPGRGSITFSAVSNLAFHQIGHSETQIQESNDDQILPILCTANHHPSSAFQRKSERLALITRAFILIVSS
jgi:hypothetical protein